MVMLVTKNGHKALLRADASPHAHMNPTKNFGDILDCRWTMRNDGGVAGSGRLQILNPLASGGIIATGGLVSINPGASVNLILFSPALVQGTHANAGANNNCRLQMLRQDGSLIAEHLFTLTMNVAGAVLVAVGDPTIT